MPGFLRRDDGDFVLRVQGDSMVEAGIFNDDLIVVHPQDDADNGEIVVALVGDEATTKRFFRDGRSIRLQPENELYEPIVARPRRRRHRRQGRGGAAQAMSGLSLATALPATLADLLGETLDDALAAGSATCLWCGDSRGRGGRRPLVRDASCCAAPSAAASSRAPGGGGRERRGRESSTSRADSRVCGGFRRARARRRCGRREPARGCAVLAARAALAGLLRFAVFLLLVFVAVWAGVRVANATVESDAFEGRSYEVQSGDTLWQIAADEYGEQRDLRAVVYAIREANGLDGALLQPGQVLTLPYLRE